MVMFAALRFILTGRDPEVELRLTPPYLGRCRQFWRPASRYCERQRGKIRSGED